MLILGLNWQPGMWLCQVKLFIVLIYFSAVPVILNFSFYYYSAVVPVILIFLRMKVSFVTFDFFYQQ